LTAVASNSPRWENCIRSFLSLNKVPSKRKTSNWNHSSGLWLRLLSALQF